MYLSAIQKIPLFQIWTERRVGGGTHYHYMKQGDFGDLFAVNREFSVWQMSPSASLYPPQNGWSA
jgi:hypothetical protein